MMLCVVSNGDALDMVPENAERSTSALYVAGIPSTRRALSLQSISREVIVANAFLPNFGSKYFTSHCRWLSAYSRLIFPPHANLLRI